MDHFDGITPDQRYKNDLLNEIRKTNTLLQQLLGRNAQTTKNVEPITRGRGRKAAN